MIRPAQGSRRTKAMMVSAANTVINGPANSPRASPSHPP